MTIGLQPTRATLNKLFAVSGNRCSFPSCSNILVENKILIGVIAHIKSKKPTNKIGDRYDPNQSDEENRHFDNLILLCSNCHTKIDSNPSDYPVEKLVEYKLKAEQEGTKNISLSKESINIIIEEFFSRFIISPSQNFIKNITVPPTYIEDKIIQTLGQHKRAWDITSLKREEIIFLVKQMNYDCVYPAFEPLTQNEISSVITNLIQKKKLSIDNNLIIDFSEI